MFYISPESKSQNEHVTREHVHLNEFLLLFFLLQGQGELYTETRQR